MNQLDPLGSTTWIDCTKVESIRFFLKVIEWKKDSPALYNIFIFVEKEKCQYVLEGFVG
jgi:hypothetical protein